MEFKGSKTEANLQTALGIAKKEGYNQIANIFEETAGNEKEHAKIWFKLLTSGGVAHSSLPDTLTNLKDAAAGENYEWTEMYAEFAKVAREEGLVWICGNCGHIVIAEQAPEVCPVCDHPKAYFELRKVNY